MIRIAVPCERAPDEKRVAIVPDSVKRLAAAKTAVTVEAGAGRGAMASDEAYAAAGAEVVVSRDALFAAADVVVKIRAPAADEVAALREGSAIIGILEPRRDPDLLRALAARGITALAVDMIPRTTAAQTMDVQSSQATAAGYEAVLVAANALPRFFPMLMTAAGTLPPARVLVLGAGVAGLTAIGAAHRLGAVVFAFDVRSAAREQIESLGARFVEVPSAADAEGEGGYAREMSREENERNAEAIAAQLAAADVCIASALVPGRRAPVLVTEAMVQGMRPGSVVVDLAAAQGGNCALTEPGRTVVAHGVTIIGDTCLPSRLAVHASQMYSRNMEKLLLHIAPGGVLAIDPRDEIVAGALVTHRGEIVHPDLVGCAR